ncbi:MAG: iron complex transport system permease protein [Natronomonas sp.]|jgi:iron complex transport system permease protein
MTTETVLRDHGETVRRKLGVLGVGVLLLLATSVIAIGVGSVRVPVADVVTVLAGGGTGTQRAIVWNVRLPRVVAAIAAGANLAIAGAAMQSVLRNPLGAPYTLGISQAAAFGVAFTIVIFGVGGAGGSGIPVPATYLTAVAAFLGALVSTGIVLLLVTYRRATPATMILTGIAIGSLFTAGVTTLQYFASDTEVAAIVYWTFGDVGRATWRSAALMAAVLVLTTAYFVRHAWDYELLDAGSKTAKSLGVDVESLRIRGMTIASLATAVVVSIVGIIGFVGLIAPHVVRKLIGGDERYLIPASALAGGTLLVAADTLARTVVAPVVLPVGVLTSFLGAPLFVYLVVVGRDYW